MNTSGKRKTTAKKAIATYEETRRRRRCWCSVRSSRETVTVVMAQSFSRVTKRCTRAITSTRTKKMSEIAAP